MLSRWIWAASSSGAAAGTLGGGTSATESWLDKGDASMLRRLGSGGGDADDDRLRLLEPDGEPVEPSSSTAEG